MISPEDLAMHLQKQFVHWHKGASKDRIHGDLFGVNGLLTTYPIPKGGDTVELRSNGETGLLLYVDDVTGSAFVRLMSFDPTVDSEPVAPEIVDIDGLRVWTPPAVDEPS